MNARFLLALGSALVTTIVACGGSDDPASSPPPSAGGSSAAKGGSSAAGHAGAGHDAGGSVIGGGGSNGGSGGAQTAAGSGGTVIGGGAGAALGGSGGAVSGGSAGAEAGGSGGSNGGSGGSEAGGSGGSLTCDDYAKPPVQSAVTIRIKNDTQKNIYLGKPTNDCQFDVGFTVTDADGHDVKVAESGCDHACSALESDTCACPPGACAVGFVTLVGPGGHYDIGWPGTGFFPQVMPDACYADASCVGTTCDLEVGLTDTYTIGAVVYDQALGCGDGGDDPCPDCTPGATGNCTVTGANRTGTNGTPLTASWAGEQGIVTLDDP